MTVRSEAPARRLLVVTALAAEQPTALHAPRWASAQRRVVGVGARGLDAAVAPDADDVIVVGSCAALRPGVPLGRLVRVTQARDGEGRVVEADETLGACLDAAARVLGLPLVRVVAADVEALVGAAEERLVIAGATGADVADMETAALLRWASAHGARAAVLRFVSDTPEADLRFLSTLGLPAADPELRDLLRLPLRLARHPGLLRPLLSLARASRSARGRIARILESTDPV